MGTVPLQATQARAYRPKVRWFHTAVSLLFVALVVAGFWPSYFGQLVRGVVARPLVLQLHGAVYTGWLLLLLAQVGLVAARRTALHRKLGQFGIYYGVLVFVVGIVVSFGAPALHVAAGEWTRDRAAGFLIIPLVDMLLFGGFFGAAILYRYKPEIHKRLILLANVALLFAAIGRFGLLPSISGFLLWLSPLLLGIAYDLFTTRRVHRVYWIGLPIFVIAFARVPLMESESWIKIARPLMDAVL